jgi:hypothetical protein
VQEGAARLGVEADDAAQRPGMEQARADVEAFEQRAQPVDR